MLIAHATRTLSLTLALVLGIGIQAHAADPAAAEAEKLARIAPAAAPAIRADRIVPLLRTKLWLDRATWETPPDAMPSHQPLTDSLFIVFAEDTGLMVRPLVQREVRALGLAPADLRRLAVANLRQMLPAPEVKRTGGAKLVITPTGYGASRILLDEFWREQRFRGEPVFALATHDMIVVADSTDPQAMETAKSVAGNFFKSYPFAISGALFVRRGDQFTSYPR
ncbi:DUF1444 family protein [Desertibaculum subflavum]|uniref:DUF1444 family protein n=1 Tax=Desertibaculum subflavum TaxID=2268458 RepID=UPI000E668CCB